MDIEIRPARRYSEEVPQVTVEVEGQAFNIDMDVEPARFAGFYAYCGPQNDEGDELIEEAAKVICALSFMSNCDPDGLKIDPSNPEYIDGQIDAHEFIDKGILPSYISKA